MVRVRDILPKRATATLAILNSLGKHCRFMFLEGRVLDINLALDKVSVFVPQMGGAVTLPVDYMSCNARAYAIGDIALIYSEKCNYGRAKVVGFSQTPPGECGTIHFNADDTALSWDRHTCDKDVIRVGDGNSVNLQLFRSVFLVDINYVDPEIEPPIGWDEDQYNYNDTNLFRSNPHSVSPQNDADQVIAAIPRSSNVIVRGTPEISAGSWPSGLWAYNVVTGGMTEIWKPPRAFNWDANWTSGGATPWIEHYSGHDTNEVVVFGGRIGGADCAIVAYCDCTWDTVQGTAEIGSSPDVSAYAPMQGYQKVLLIDVNGAQNDINTAYFPDHDLYMKTGDVTTGLRSTPVVSPSFLGGNYRGMKLDLLVEYLFPYSLAQSFHMLADMTYPFYNYVEQKAVFYGDDIYSNGLDVYVFGSDWFIDYFPGHSAVFGKSYSPSCTASMSLCRIDGVTRTVERLLFTDVQNVTLFGHIRVIDITDTGLIFFLAQGVFRTRDDPAHRYYAGVYTMKRDGTDIQFRDSVTLRYLPTSGYASATGNEIETAGSGAWRDFTCPFQNSYGEDSNQYQWRRYAIESVSAGGITSQSSLALHGYDGEHKTDNDWLDRLYTVNQYADEANLTAAEVAVFGQSRVVGNPLRYAPRVSMLGDASFVDPGTLVVRKRFRQTDIGDGLFEHGVIFQLNSDLSFASRADTAMRDRVVSVGKDPGFPDQDDGTRQPHFRGILRETTGALIDIREIDCRLEVSKGLRFLVTSRVVNPGGNNLSLQSFALAFYRGDDDTSSDFSQATAGLPVGIVGYLSDWDMNNRYHPVLTYVLPAVGMTGGVVRLSAAAAGTDTKRGAAVAQTGAGTAPTVVVQMRAAMKTLLVAVRSARVSTGASTVAQVVAAHKLPFPLPIDERMASAVIYTLGVKIYDGVIDVSGQFIQEALLVGDTYTVRDRRKSDADSATQREFLLNLTPIHGVASSGVRTVVGYIEWRDINDVDATLFTTEETDTSSTIEIVQRADLRITSVSVLPARAVRRVAETFSVQINVVNDGEADATILDPAAEVAIVFRHSVEGVVSHYFTVESVSQDTDPIVGGGGAAILTCIVTPLQGAPSSLSNIEVTVEYYDAVSAGIRSVSTGDPGQAGHGEVRIEYPPQFKLYALSPQLPTAVNVRAAAEGDPFEYRVNIRNDDPDAGGSDVAAIVQVTAVSATIHVIRASDLLDVTEYYTLPEDSLPLNLGNGDGVIYSKLVVPKSGAPAGPMILSIVPTGVYVDTSQNWPIDITAVPEIGNFIAVLVP